jgi:eukaryotic-like serine/threonine-protein kinase
MNESTPSSRDRELEALVGRTVAGKYGVLRLIGRGGMGAVYEAENLAIGKKVALKFVDREFAKDEQVTGRFAREARAASSVESANIVTVFDAGVDDGRPYLVMELLRGEDLGSRLRRLGRIPLADALHIAAQVLRGLGRAHEAGIVHRDLKPDNVFLVKGDGDPLFAKIVDFGVSKIHRAPSGTAPVALTGKGTVVGTPLYMSPEQARASEDLDGRTDLYALGSILFECLAGRPPHTGESYEQIILSVCMTDAPPLMSVEPSVPPAVSAFVAKALARDRTMRFANAQEMLRALHEIAPEERLRVPLDPLSGATLPSGSGGHAVSGPAPTPGISAPPAGPPTDVSWSRASKPARAATPAPAPPSLATRLAVPLTAFGATLAGVIVTSWIVTSFRKDHTVSPPPAITQAQTVTVPSSAPTASASAPLAATASPTATATATAPLAATASPTATATASPIATASPTPTGGGPTRGAPRPAVTPPPATAKPAPTPTAKPLDISRELPN